MRNTLIRFIAHTKWQVENMPFDELSGIELREKAGQDKNALEKILEICDYLCRNTSEVYRYLFDTMNSDSEFYSHVRSFALSKTRNIDFNEKDICDFIIAKSYEKQEKEGVIGLFSGVLLDILTERNRKQKKKTIIKIDGKGAKFSYLFYGARNFDEIYLSNFNGRYICAKIGSEGRGGIAALSRIDGSYTGESAGAFSGGIDALIVNSATDNELCSKIGFSGGKAGLVLISNSKAFLAGSSIARDGSAGMIVLNQIISEHIGDYIGEGGHVKKLAMNSLSGSYVGRNIGTNNGEVSEIALRDIKASYVFSSANFERTRSLIRYNDNEAEIYFRKNRIDRIISLSEDIDLADDIDELERISKKIYREYRKGMKNGA
ncbi:MAG: hypothetical protein NTV63_04830 [Candidatus Woesearchaeota archaeon]|nr:hypothetical protein [Candidatus Woesearchaeota archaeon]